VVFVRDSDGERVLDSKRSLKYHVRRDFGRMKPKGYIKVIRRRAIHVQWPKHSIKEA